MKKKVLRLLLAVGIMSAMFVFGTVIAYGADYYATRDVFVRSGPDVSSSVISGYTRGDWVDVVEKVGDWWYKVRLGSGATGYASALFVHEPQNVSTSGLTLKTVNTPFLNVRAGAGIGWLEVGMLYKGEQVYVVETYADGWVKVTNYGFTAYVFGRYLD